MKRDPPKPKKFGHAAKDNKSQFALSGEMIELRQMYTHEKKLREKCQNELRIIKQRVSSAKIKINEEHATMSAINKQLVTQGEDQTFIKSQIDELNAMNGKLLESNQQFEISNEKLNNELHDLNQQRIKTEDIYKSGMHVKEDEIAALKSEIIELKASLDQQRISINDLHTED